MRSTNTSEQKNNNQAKDVSSFDNSYNSFLFDDTLLAVRELSVIRGKERSHEFMNRQKLLFEQVKELFDIDSIDIPEQTMNQMNQMNQVNQVNQVNRMNQVNQVNQVNQMKQSIRRPRGRPSGKERERDDRENYRDARDDARDGARDDARDDASDVHIKDLRLSIDHISMQIKC